MAFSPTRVCIYDVQSALALCGEEAVWMGWSHKPAKTWRQPVGGEPALYWSRGKNVGETFEGLCRGRKPLNQVTSTRASGSLCHVYQYWNHYGESRVAPLSEQQIREQVCPFDKSQNLQCHCALRITKLLLRCQNHLW